MKSNYDKQPTIKVDGKSYKGYETICLELKKNINNKCIIAIDFYPGVRKDEIENGIIKALNPEVAIYSDDIYFDNKYVSNKIADNMTDDRVFGIMTHYTLDQFIDSSKKQDAVNKIQNANGLVIVYGVGASLLCTPNIHIYADLARWEIQSRFRSGELNNWKSNIQEKDQLKKFKRGFFFEWRMADRHKKLVLKNTDYILDTNLKNNPKMINTKTYFKGLEKASKSPFRVVPFFDPGVWGGQWLKETCDLDRNTENFAWAFDCVPEENSILINVDGEIIETPSINLVFMYPTELLGEKVYARFGAEFPIRFDFLDTMGGQNLSLQVHPLTEYIYDKFGMAYTQDESYYILSAKDDAVVYLGIKTGTNKDDFITDLERAQNGEISFDANKYVNVIKTKKHDHFCIPAGTVHCSGTDTVVLEISATPYIFTFKLWDWDRLGLDGKPRPVHINHGKNVIQFNRDTKWTNENLVNNFKLIKDEEGNKEEITGLYKTQFIETRRNWFSKPVLHNTNGVVNVLNLVEGDECIVESPTNDFEPFVVHYAETFIIPASVGEYTISPYGLSEGKTIATIKAYVKI